IDATHVGPQGLRPQVRRRIDEQAQPVVTFDVDRGPESIVSWVGGRTDGTVAPDHGHAVRCPRPEERHTHRCTWYFTNGPLPCQADQAHDSDVTEGHPFTL